MVLRVGGLAPPYKSPFLLTRTPRFIISFSFTLPNEIHNFCSSSASLFPPSFLLRRNGFGVSALKKRRKGGDGSVLSLDGFEEEEKEDDEDGDDVDGIFLPFSQMKNWLQNKPPGFGEGKVYDTSVEDELFEEMQHSRQAQLANINNLKNNPIKVETEKDHHQEKNASKVVPTGICVRIVNLPKKKNIHRDLQLAFKGVSGITDIVPSVTGNKKTRDPVCKGLAFVYFKSVEDANRFGELFSGQTVSFGKIQKQIKCEMLNPKSPNSGAPLLTVPNVKDSHGIHPDSENSLEETVVDESKDYDDQFISAQLDIIGEKEESFKASEEAKPVSGTNSPSAKRREKSRVVEKKAVNKQIREKAPKLNIPGSAKRLKIKEKAVLTGVFTKYGPKAASASNEGS